MTTLQHGVTTDERPSQVADALARLETYCRDRDWAGFDPYDALNSELFGRTPLVKSRLARLAFTQAVKRSPLDVRRALRIQPRQEPKALALFLMSSVKQAQRGDGASRATAAHLAGRLLELRSPRTDYWCWGYSFPWQTRDRLVPRSAPNLVCTTFAANALLDAYESGLGEELLGPAVSAGEYVFRELYWKDGDRTGFAYPLPDVRETIHNANLLGAAILCRLAGLTGDKTATNAAREVTRYAVGKQRADGSWPYGDGRPQQWIDNFHTGYNLCALKSIGADLESDEFLPALRRGFAFYRDHFFAESGAPKYFHNRTYPIDVHSAAQSLITLAAFRQLDPGVDALRGAVLAWTLGHLYDERGFFYYQVRRGLTVRTPYMRWSQAWMCLALATLLSEDGGMP